MESGTEISVPMDLGKVFDFTVLYLHPQFGMSFAVHLPRDLVPRTSVVSRECVYSSLRCSLLTDLTFTSVHCIK